MFSADWRAASRDLAVTMLIAAAGAVVAALIGLPAPFLIGPAVATTIAALFGVTMGFPVTLRDACLLVIGLSMGTSVTPEVIAAIGKWPLSFIMVLVATVVLLAIGFVLLHRLFRYDRNTALLGASPGHLGYVLSLAVDLRCDLRAVGVIQSIRLLALTVTVPVLVAILDLSGEGPAPVATVMGVPVLLATLLAAALLALVFDRLRLPTAIMLAGCGVSIATHVSGLVHGAIPDWLLLPVYVALGAQIGMRFSGVTMRELRRAFFAGAVVTMVATAAAAVIALAVAAWTGIRLDAVLIAFAPGGLETMAAMAVMLNADPAYVGAHHVLRLLFLSFLMPVVIAWSARR